MSNTDEAARGVRAAFAAGFRSGAVWGRGLVGRLGDKLIPSRARERAALELVAEYESAITWGTHCLNCSRLLTASYADYERADRAEADVRALQALLAEIVGLNKRRDGS